jgi:thiamine-monophosphate kinase
LPLAEKALIARIRRRAGRGGALVAGIGDDAAVLRIPRGHEALITTDFSLEGIHFRREWHSPESIGHRCLSRGLSDIAAMGGQPIAVFLSLALPRKLPQRWVDRFVSGLLTLANRFGVKLAGGDTAESPTGILADIIVLGSVPRGKAILRSGARPGDNLYVTGKLGGSAPAVRRMIDEPRRKLNERDFSGHFFPEPRVHVGRILRERNLPSAMIDISDGLSTDLGHLCDESRVGAELQADLIPIAAVGKPARAVDLGFALTGGEDYELLFTAPPLKRIPASIAGVPITQVGLITRRQHVILRRENGGGRQLLPQGWEHLRR